MRAIGGAVAVGMLCLGGTADATPPPGPSILGKPPVSSAASPGGRAPFAAARSAVAAFHALCAAGALSPAAVIARADTAGWRRAGPNAPKDFDPANQRMSPDGTTPMLLRVSSDVGGGERRDICAVSVAVPAQGLADATREWLGFAPALVIGLSANFFAIRHGETWTSGAALARPAFNQAKAAGEFYGIMVGDRGAGPDAGAWPACLMLLRVQPAPGVSTPR